MQKVKFLLHRRWVNFYLDGSEASWVIAAKVKYWEAIKFNRLCEFLLTIKILSKLEILRKFGLFLDI